MADAEVLFAAHRDGVFRYLCRIVSAPDARELTQEVFLRVARGPVPDGDPGASRAWIYRIARNLALNHLRDSRRGGASVELSDAPVAASQETGAVLRQALERLALMDRDVFLLREVGGLSYGELATACDLSEDAVRSRLHRARQQLRQMLRPMLNGERAWVPVRLYDKRTSDE